MRNESCCWKKNAALFLTGQALSLFGTMIVQYAILWHVVLESRSGSMMTFFTIAGFLPLLFVSPFAGVWADRFNRKHIINIADGTIALFSLAAAIFIMRGGESYALLFVCAFVRSIGQGVQMPAVGAFIPQIVPEEHLAKVNGIQASVQSLITLVSPMAGAALMAFTKLEYMFLVDVVTASIGISIVLFFVKVPDMKKTGDAGTDAGTDAGAETSIQNKPSYLDDLKEGLKYIRGHGYVMRMLVVAGIYVFLFAPAAFLTPLQVTRNFGAEVWRLSALEIVFSIGAMAGGLLIGVWGGFRNRTYTMAAATMLSGIMTAALGVLTPTLLGGAASLAVIFGFYLAMMGLLGITLSYFNTTAMTLLQTTVEPAFMGRVFSVYTMLSGGLMPLGMVAFGPLADVEFMAFGLSALDWILILTGLAIATLFVPLMTSKTLRAAGVSHLKG